MVEEARDAGFKVTKRLVTDWADLGLLAHPDRVSRGKGAGTGARYVWPDSQRDLFITLLRKRPTVTALASLAVVPVSVWLYWGDDWIELPQVRRALKTWTATVGKQRSLQRAQAHARDAVRRIAGTRSRTRAQRELEDAITDALWNRKMDRTKVEPLVRQVFDETSTQTCGPFHWGADAFMNYLEVNFIAADNLDKFTDGDFYEARARQRQHILEYAQQRDVLQARVAFGRWFEDPNLEMIVNQSCWHLLTNLGGRVLAKRNGVALEPVQLATWTRPPDELMRLPD
jgi:hypothetical protein